MSNNVPSLPSAARMDARTRRNVVVLVLAQAILGSQMPILFVGGGLVGNQLSSNPCLATLPISLIVFGSMCTAPWLSPLMQKHGRRAGFIVGALAGALGGAIAACGVWSGSFVLVLLGSFFSGVYMSAQGFFRFAAADSAAEKFRPKAISYVMAGGLAAAILGPQLNKLTFDVAVIPFFGSYLAVVTLNLLGMFLFFALDLPKTAELDTTVGSARARSRIEMLRSTKIAVAIICAMVSYALMNLVMTSTPLAVVGCGYSADAANDVVSAHVLAMFVPSFFTGHLIQRFGVERVISLGLVILALAGGVALAGVDISNFFVALILLGVGWNFGFIGATTLLATSHSASERGVIQGLNDGLVYGCVTLASLASGGLMNCSGGSPVEGWTAVNVAMAPFLVLAGGALIWLSIYNARQRRA